jgi:hypothetical protein
MSRFRHPRLMLLGFRQQLLGSSNQFVIGHVWIDEIEAPFHRQMMAVVAEQLRLVWNARGAADLATIETDLSAMMGVTMAGPYVKNLDIALRTLDR